MKKLLQNNQVIITALAIMIAIAGYLNFSNNNSNNIGVSGEYYEASKDVISNDVESKKTEDKKNKKEKKEEKNEKVIQEQDSENIDKEKNVATVNEDINNIGEAVLVNSNITLDYFYSIKLDREQTRAKNKEELLKIVENNAISEKDKEIAVNKIVELTANSEKENASEMMLKAKGFKNPVVSIVDSKVDVVIDAEKITEEEVASIAEVVNRKTGIEIKNIVITPVNSNKKANQ